MTLWILQIPKSKKNPDVYKENKKDMKTLDNIMSKISGDKRK